MFFRLPLFLLSATALTLIAYTYVGTHQQPQRRPFAQAGRDRVPKENVPAGHITCLIVKTPFMSCMQVLHARLHHPASASSPILLSVVQSIYCHDHCTCPTYDYDRACRDDDIPPNWTVSQALPFQCSTSCTYLPPRF